MISLDDIIEDTKVDLTKVDSSVVVKLAMQMTAMAGEVAAMEEKIKELKAHIFTLSTETIPEAMDACGLKEFTLADGYKIEVNPIIKGSLPSKGAIEKASDEEKPLLEMRLKAGLQFLRDNKAGPLIKNELTIEIGKGKDNVVTEIEKLAEELGMDFYRDESVHAQTLNKWIKEKIGEGLKIPEDTFSIFNGRQAVVAKTKSKK